MQYLLKRIICLTVKQYPTTIPSNQFSSQLKNKLGPFSNMAPKSTTTILRQLRDLMQNPQFVKPPINAYIIPSNDSHNSEYIADCDKRRGFISGFTGSAGTAIVTEDHACLWTDGRYFLQATEEMDENWTLMKEGVLGTPTQREWLIKALPMGSKVGVDPKLFTWQMWQAMESGIEAAGLKLVPVPTNLIDEIWPDQPPRPANPVLPLGLEFTGRTIADKLVAIRAEMSEKRAHALVLTALDDIAWTLNLRGSDIEYNPVFFSYMVIQRETFAIFINQCVVSDEVKQHLLKENNDHPINIRNYDEIEPYLKQVAGKCCNEDHIWVSDTANCQIVAAINPKALLLELSPVKVMKAIKNPVEIAGMRNAHLKDAAALCCYFAWLEKNLACCSLGTITEVSGAYKGHIFRACQFDFVGDSFPMISAVGPHGAIIHYQPSEKTDVPITCDQLYLCDSGAQFKDGTTDVTRTLHFGTPTEYEKECFTRVLKGQISLATSVFPNKLKGNCLDSFARQHLWAVGLDYPHGTGHGIGSYLNVHEGPMGISWRAMPDDPGLQEGMFISNEPGYYEDGKFGIRIEDIVQVVPAKTPHNHQQRGYLTFETITLVPKQLKMINVGMLTTKEIEHLNDYHQRCRELVGPLLVKQMQMDALDWLFRETKPITPIRCN